MDPTKPTPSPPLSFTIDPSLVTYDVPVSDFISKRGYCGLVVASAVFRQQTPKSPPRLLLIQRAAHDWCPSLWELPGGSADPLPGVRVVDEAARELWEETGLRATSATALVGTYTWIDGENVDGEVTRGDGDPESEVRNKKAVWKGTFLFEVEGNQGAGEGEDGEDGARVVLDPEEHQAFVWATEDEAKMDRCGDVDIRWTFAAQKANALEAFDALRRVQK
jgi:8-oxo-dGTP pyrophosphatase MutT (NUDIX family)